MARLYERMSRQCSMFTQQRVDDGEGGYESQWVFDREFKAAIVLDSSAKSLEGDHRSTFESYTITFPADVPLKFDDRVVDAGSGNAYRIVSNPESKATPDVASFSFKQATAERWEAFNER